MKIPLGKESSKITTKDKIKILLQVWYYGEVPYRIKYNRPNRFESRTMFDSVFIFKNGKVVNFVEGLSSSMSIFSSLLQNKGLTLGIEGTDGKDGWMGYCKGPDGVKNFVDKDPEIAIGGAALKYIGIDMNEKGGYLKAQKDWNQGVKPIEIINKLNELFLKNDLTTKIRFEITSSTRYDDFGKSVLLYIDYIADKGIYRKLLQNGIAKTVTGDLLVHNSKLKEGFGIRTTENGVRLFTKLDLGIGHDYEKKLEGVISTINRLYSLGSEMLVFCERPDKKMIEINYNGILSKIIELRLKPTSRDDYLNSCSKNLPAYVENLPGFPGWDVFIEQINSPSIIERLLKLKD